MASSSSCHMASPQHALFFLLVTNTKSAEKTVASHAFIAARDLSAEIIRETCDTQLKMKIEHAAIINDQWRRPFNTLASAQTSDITKQ
jgi:hypothetical protein